MGIWIISPFLLLLSIINPPLYRAFLAAGFQVETCIAWDENGKAVPGVCTTPAPPILTWDDETGGGE